MDKYRATTVPNPNNQNNGLIKKKTFSADQAAFRGQNIGQIFSLMDQTLARLFPKVKSIYFVPPIAIDREQTPHAIQIYNQLLEQGEF